MATTNTAPDAGSADAFGPPAAAADARLAATRADEPAPAEPPPLTARPDRLPRFTVYFLLMLGAMAAFVVSFILYTRAQGVFEQANETRQMSILLADELRQSSNDLTRLVRTYVVTGDPIFKKQFREVLDIRDGHKPRPSDYGPSYWDFNLVAQQKAPTTGTAVPLLDLMRRAGFTDQEFAKLAESKARSDALTRTEFEAMALIEADRPTDPVKRARAIHMLHDHAFNQAKADIMLPISEFDRMVNSRTLHAVQAAQKEIARLRVVLTAIGVLLVHFLWMLNQQLHAILGCTVPELQQIIRRLGVGDFSYDIHVPDNKRDSVLSWVAETKNRLAKMELLQFKAIVDSSDDAIISKTCDGIITSWNRGAEQIFGYPAHEVIGRPMQLLVPPDRADEEPRILAKVSSGARVEHFETKRRRKDGVLIDVSTTISPIMDPSGRVIGVSKIARDITRSKEAEAEIHRLAHYDALTGLPNRRLLQDRLEQGLATARRRGSGCAILFIDLDNFKSLNDTQGHDVGDLLLQQVATRLTACVRASDTVARFGGDEFVVVLEDQDGCAELAAIRAEEVGQKILTTLSHPYQLGRHAHHCTPSVGISLFSGQSGHGDDLLKQADMAMYRAKASGRNTLRFFNPEMQTVVDGNALMDRDLREALEDHQFELYYQPQVAIHGGLIGAEALVRWRHPVRGLVSPAAFIPRAEETGFILPLGQWVLETACRQLAHWARMPEFAGLTLAVNVSASQLYQADFVAQVMGAVASAGANPQRLKLEITETMLVSHAEELIAKMTTLKAHGVSFSLDDFGTGYSSLSYLKRLPLEQLKIDRGFVKNILTDPYDSGIAKMVIALAQSLGIEVLAEGIETEPQRAFLADQGCHAYQGFLLSRPLPARELEALVLNHFGSRGSAMGGGKPAPGPARVPMC